MSSFFLFTVRDIFAIENSLNFYDKMTGDDLIHIVKESPISFYATYNVPKSSPFIQKLNLAIVYAREFGIIECANSKMLHLLEMKRFERFKKIMKARKEEQPISVDHLKNVLKFFLICCCICCCTFLTEIFVHKLMMLKRN